MRFPIPRFLYIPAFCAAFLADFSGFAATPTPVYGDPKAPVDRRVSDLLGQLTLSEKISLLSGASFMSTHGVPRLGIPALKMTDGPMGARCYGPSTAYPNGVILAATWDVSQAEAAGEAIGRDARARGVNILLAPGMNLYRAPMCGRNFEYLGEDPLVAGSMASAFIRGVQSQGVAATAKHFAGNEQEFNRHGLNTEVDERTLRELYLKPFSMTVAAGVWCVMDSYNPLNGTHSTQNDWLNNHILKGEFGFKGVVMSDWNSCYDTLGMATGGLDLEMPGGQYFNEKLLMPLLGNGSVTMAMIDDKVRRQLTMAFSMGWFDRPQLDPAIPKDDPSSAKVALAGAREGIVLLKNDGNLLPLDPARIKKIVVIGHNAEPAVTGAAGSAFTHPFHAVSVLDGLKNAGGPAKIVQVPWLPGQAAVPQESVADVKQADAVIVCVGFNDLEDHGAQAKREGSEGEGADRTYALPWMESSLIASAAAINPKTIVILNAGGSVETKDWIEKAPVLLDAFYPGQAGGTAIAEILFGVTNPSGKLPFSWEKQWEDSAAYGNYPTAEHQKANTYKEGVFLGYRWFDAMGIKPLFPFGFGLGYTTFEFSNAALDMYAARGIAVSATIRNTGSRAGADVVQVYIEPPKAGVPRPVRELKAFTKVTLKPGETKTVSVPISRGDLAYWDAKTGSWAITPGTYTARVGDSSENLPLTVPFQIGE